MLGLLTAAQSLAHWFPAHPQAHLLIVVDQLEELITLCRNEPERQQFLGELAEALTNHPTQLHLVLTLRSDFEPQFRDTALESHWQAARFIVPAMTREGLRQAIEKPASARVIYFDPHELVDQLIDEVANMPGTLPLLSFALSELYLNYLKRQETAKLQGETIDRAITQADYEQVGGVTTSLTQRADQEYEELVKVDPAYARTIRNVMLRMVSVGSELARRRVPLLELEYPEPENERVQTVLKCFSAARLLTPGTDSEGQPYQEPAHDALVRGWKRLLDWRQEHLRELLLQRDLTSDANQWTASSQKKQDSGLLWIEDPRLATALQLSCGRAYKDNWRNLFRWHLDYQTWQSQSPDYWLNRSEADFVWQSFDHKFKRFRNSVLSIAGVIIALSGLTGFALINQRLAEERATIAQLREQAARVLNLLSTPNTAKGLVLAIDTMERSRSVPTVEMLAQASLLSAVQMSLEVNLLQGHEGPVMSVAFSPNGQHIISGSHDNTVRLWNAQTGTEIRQLDHGSWVSAVAFSPDDQHIVSGGNDTVQLWNAQTGKMIWQAQQDQDEVYSVAFSPVRVVTSQGLGYVIASGNRDKTGRSDNTVRLWDAQTGQPIGQPLRGHKSTVSTVAFSPDGQRIASGSADGTVRLWDAQTGLSIGQPLQGHRGWASAVAFSPDGQRIVSGSSDKTLRLWDAQTGQPIGEPLQGHQDGVNSVAFSPNGQCIVSGSSDGTLRLWDAQTGQPIGEPLRGHEGLVESVAFSPDGKHIVSVGGWDQMVRLWDVETGLLIGQPLQSQDAVYSVAFSPDGQRIVSGGADTTLRLWNSLNGQPIGRPLRGHERLVHSATFSPDGQRIVSGSWDQTVRLWDAQTRQPIGEPLRGHESTVISVAFSPNGKTIVSSSHDGTLRLWDAQTRQPIGEPLRGHRGPVNAVAFSPDGQHMVSGSWDQTLRLWDAQTRQQIGQPFTGDSGRFTSVAFSPDGQRIVSGSTAWTVRLWDTQTGQPIGQPLQGHRDEVESVAFSPDGQRIVSGSLDNTVRLWDARTGQPIGQPLQGHRDRVDSVAFSPDGKRLVSGSADGTLRLWGVSPEGWLAIACNRLQYHPLLNQPEKATSDPAFLEVAHRARTVCQQRVWHQQSDQKLTPVSWFQQIIQWMASR